MDTIHYKPCHTEIDNIVGSFGNDENLSWS